MYDELETRIALLEFDVGNHHLWMRACTWAVNDTVAALNDHVSRQHRINSSERVPGLRKRRKIPGISSSTY